MRGSCGSDEGAVDGVWIGDATRCEPYPIYFWLVARSVGQA